MLMDFWQIPTDDQSYLRNSLLHTREPQVTNTNIDSFAAKSY